eukprot:COSAG01_NODE_5407_length_4281_cov_1.613196_5_plen_52_part_00
MHTFNGFIGRITAVAHNSTGTEQQLPWPRLCVPLLLAAPLAGWLSCTLSLK